MTRLSKILDVTVAALLAALTIVVTFQILGRYVPFVPRPLWTEEIARWLLAWMVFLGAAVALRRNDHFLIDMIPRRLDERFGRALQVLVLVILLLISLSLLFGGTLMTYGGFSRVSTASGLHLAWAFASLPVGGLFMAIFSVEVAIRMLRGQPFPSAEDSTEDALGGNDSSVQENDGGDERS